MLFASPDRVLLDTCVISAFVNNEMQPAEAREIKSKHLVARVGKVPRGKRQCLSLPLPAFSEALDQLERRK